jgi:hypothetical protein
VDVGEEHEQGVVGELGAAGGLVGGVAHRRTL